MKKRVDLLQVTDAENRLTQLGCTFPISCTTKAATGVVDTRGGGQKRVRRRGEQLDAMWRYIIDTSYMGSIHPVESISHY